MKADSQKRCDAFVRNAIYFLQDLNSFFSIGDLLDYIEKFGLFVDETAYKIFASAYQLLKIKLREIKEVERFNGLTGT